MDKSQPAVETLIELDVLHPKIRELQQAKDYHQQALEIRKMQLGPNHVDVATCYSNLAGVYSKIGKLKQAKDYY